MNEVIKQLGLNHGLSEYEANELASHNVSWIRHGDLIVLPKAFFDNYLWKKLIMSAGDEVWKAIARGYECSRIILQEKISNNRYIPGVHDIRSYIMYYLYTHMVSMYCTVLRTYFCF